MPAPLAKGLIIAASVLVAAGIAIYESPQVRAWVEQSRRRIAIALHSLGDEIQPRRPSESTSDFEERKRRREEIVRRNRNDLIKRAREDGVAVDLDELVKIGRDVEEVEREMEMAERRHMGHRGRTNSGKSFDDLVGSDGMLRQDTTGKATGVQSAETIARRRGAAGFAAGTALGSNPFTDDAQIFFDQDDAEEAKSPKEFSYIETGTRESSATLGGTPAPASGDLIDLTPEEMAFIQDMTPASPHLPQEQQDMLSQADDTEQAAQSFYSFTSSTPNLENSTALSHMQIPAHTPDDNIDTLSVGTLTPRSEHSGFTTGASIVGSQADDVAVLSMQNDDDHDARSEAFSEGGFTDAGFSEAGFSDVGSQRQGVMTPSSWTDVGSDDESEWGGNQGHVSQVHQ